MSKYYKNQAGKIIGKVSGDTYIKNVKKSKHLLRMWNALGIDKQVIFDLIRTGVSKILIHESEENKDYSVTVKDFMEKGIEADFGHSKQLFLPIVYFSIENVN